MSDPTTALDESARREAALQHVDRLAYWLDERFAVPGTRFRIGLDGLLGLIPGVGDLAGTALSLLLLLWARRLGAPWSLLVRMAWNVLLDTVVGAIPVLGDLFDFGFKANRRNMLLLKRFLAAEPRARKRR